MGYSKLHRITIDLPVVAAPETAGQTSLDGGVIGGAAAGGIVVVVVVGIILIVVIVR